MLFISSRTGQAVPGFDVVLEPSHPAFAKSGLKVASVFRIAKVAALSDALIAGTLGQVDAGVFSEIVRRLVQLLETGQLPRESRLNPAG